MANKEAQELRAMNDDELRRRLAEVQSDLMATRFGLATRQTENTARLSTLKREIARIKTILHERELEGINA